MQQSVAGSRNPIGAAAFYPAHIKPAGKPLRFPSNLIKLLNNNLEAIPEQVYREPFVLASGPPRMAFFTDPELVKLLLLSRQSEFPKSTAQVETMKPLFGEAMFASEGREWKWQHAAVAPLFRHEELLRYGPAICAAADATVETWRGDSAGVNRLINEDMMRAAFRVMSSAMLGGGAEDTIHAIEQGHADYFRSINWWVLYAVLGLPSWLPRPGRTAMRSYETRLRMTISEMAASRRGIAATGQDLLARLMRASNPETQQSMSEQLVVDNLISFLVSGYETTALAMTWTLYLIACSPEWEAAMLAEIEQVAGSGPVTAAHVPKLVVVQQVLNESLRLYPTVPIVARDINAELKMNGSTIPAGTIAVIPIYAIHRHRSHWEDPDRFNPGRFAPSNPTKPTRYQFMPFGAGPRICIGAAFAMLEATIMLATFVRAARFEVDPAFDPQPVGQMFLVPKHGMPMRVLTRQRAC